MPNSAFTVDDLCQDPNFIGWVLHPTEESDRFWRTFIANYPHKAADIQQAIDYIRTLRFREIDPAPADLDRLWQRIWNDIDQKDEFETVTPASHDRPVPVISWYRQPYWAAAAVVLLVASVVVGWWAYRANASLTYQTDYGNTQEIRLPDGSVVTLNAHSSLRVADHLAMNPLREVWLDGEAYFEVARRNGAKFIVHTAEVDVEVLGTSFNVNTRRAKTSVVLTEGKVQLRTANQSSVVMKPGDMATVLPKRQRIDLKQVQPDAYDTWKESYLVLDGKSVPDIIHTLEDTFGVTIRLQADQLAQKKLTGRLKTAVADDCIENLSLILEADLKKDGNTYVFE